MDPLTQALAIDVANGRAKAAAPPAQKRVIKIDAAKRLITVWGYISKDPSNQIVPAEHTTDDGTVVDHSGDVLDVDDLEAAMHVFARGDHDVDEMHENGVGDAPEGAEMRAEAMEWFVFTEPDRKALGLPDDFPEGVILKIKIHDDDLFAKVESGDLPMLSLAGAFEEAAA